jgi:tRNA threonylcarbamoyl adenosine modification protein (Sua5/YciO/YrdC/YwlC family)
MSAAVIDLRNAEDWRDVVHRAVQALAEGGVVALPTETVYGIAVSALREDAVVRLQQLKSRTAAKPFTLAIKSADEARDYSPRLNALGRRLARRCWPGPITLVVDGSHPESLVRQLPLKVQRAVAPQGTVGLRVPAHPAVLDVLRMLAGPLALTSANLPGRPEAASVKEIIEAFGDHLTLALDDGPCRFGQPSSVVQIMEKDYKVLRAGVVPERTLQRLASFVTLFVCTGNTCRSPMAEILCRDALAKRLGCKIDALEDRGVVVMSAGIATMMGGRAASEAVETMSTFGLDLSGHETQPMTESLARQADVIFAMTRSHREAIVGKWPSAAERTLTLSPDGEDISDPIGGSLERYRCCAEKIRAAIEARIAQLEIF